ncbi:MAG: DUF1822 family protein [Symploca sp. SIO3E6]|nr:DUF1822 family protein [Caldora sp. SIO3E6]
MLLNKTMNKQQFLPMPLTQKAIKTAQQFAAEQPYPQEAEQIYLNTLAVLAVRDYLQLMEIDTELTQSDSWNPVVRMCEDVADLIVEGLGKLECRPVRTSQTAANSICPIPAEALDDRIGYIVVEIDEGNKQATLLGFSQTIQAGELVLNQLRSLDELLAHLDYLAQSRVNLSQWLVNSGTTNTWQKVESPVETEPVMPGVTNSGEPNKLNLGQRFENILNQGWQTLEEIVASLDNKQLQPQFRGSLPHPQPALAFRRGGLNLFPNADVMRAKLVDLGIQLGNQPVTLVMALTQEMDQKVNILVQVHPVAGEMYVPSQLKLALLSELGETLQEVESRGRDVWIQLKQFRVQPQTNFSIQVALGGVSIKEAFTI